MPFDCGAVCNLSERVVMWVFRGVPRNFDFACVFLKVCVNNFSHVCVVSQSSAHKFEPLLHRFVQLVLDMRRGWGVWIINYYSLIQYVLFFEDLFLKYHFACFLKQIKKNNKNNF